MAIKAKNMKVGGVNPPTPVKETKPVSFTSFGALRNKAAPKEEPKLINNPPPPVNKLAEEPEQKYIYKTDGELIRHINKKSAYLRDMLEVSN
ncbi:MAG: hypothetical protein [Caudoviricetes sp.]|nr:MAG: hypothetical protein [Caudoviricetes sp.]